MSPQSESELPRTLSWGKGSCHTTFGADGSVTSSTEKHIGGFSCARYMIRRPSRAILTAMPSPAFGAPPRSLRPIRLKLRANLTSGCLLMRSDPPCAAPPGRPSAGVLDDVHPGAPAVDEVEPPVLVGADVVGLDRLLALR